MELDSLEAECKSVKSYAPQLWFQHRLGANPSLWCSMRMVFILGFKPGLTS